MFAIIRTGGKQYLVREGQELAIEKVPSENGKVVFSDVLMIGGDTPAIGTPLIANARVEAEHLGDERGKKIVVQKFKPKVRYRRRTGHRQTHSRVRIGKIIAP